MADDFVIGKIEFSTTTVARPQTFQVVVPSTVAKSEPSVPLSAIRALVQQWEAEAACQDASSFTGAGFALAKLEDSKQLAALCPAPPEDQK